MRFREQISPSEQIRNINCITDGDECTLSWLWPREILYVYICRTREGEGEEEYAIDQIGDNNSILYTRDEYMEYSGYHDRSPKIGRYTYKIYPMVQESGDKVLVNQNDKDNCITVSTGKVRINCRVKEKNKIFSHQKTVKIVVYPEVPVNRDVICYVKKSGSIPSSASDGIIFPFLQDFKAGENILPEIEVGKDEYIRLFLTNSKTNGEIYEIIYR